jgi:hypothetical protein
VNDAAGQALAYVYFEDEKGRRDVMKRLTKDEARRIAVNIAKLPTLVAKGGRSSGDRNLRPPDGAKVSGLP